MKGTLAKALCYEKAAAQYTFVAVGIAGPEKWLNANLGGKHKGMQACYEAVVAEPECAQDYFTYVTRGDKNCGCKRKGSFQIRNDAKSDYYAMQASAPAPNSYPNNITISPMHFVEHRAQGLSFTAAALLILKGV